MRFLSDRAIPGVESFDGTTFRRAVRTSDGRPAVIGLTPRLDGDGVLLRVVAEGIEEPSPLVRLARRLFDLDTDPTEIDATLSADPALGPLVRATPGIRLPGSTDGFELAVRAILGQQVSVRAARTFAGRIAEASGTPLERPVEGVTRLFPTAEQLAEGSLGSLGLTKARENTLKRLAELVATGDVDLSGATDREATAERLLAVPGIGPVDGRVRLDARPAEPRRISGRRPGRPAGLRGARVAVRAGRHAGARRALAAVARLRGHAPVERRTRP